MSLNSTITFPLDAKSSTNSNPTVRVMTSLVMIIDPYLHSN